jgi:uncharacterized protein YaaQ
MNVILGEHPRKKRVCMNSSPLDRLVILTVFDSQADPLMKQLTLEGFHFTVINSTGGTMQEAVICLLVGFSHERMPVLLEIVRNNCHPYKKFIPTQGLMPGELVNIPMLEAQLGGALIYTMNIERFEQI